MRIAIILGLSLIMASHLVSAVDKKNPLNLVFEDKPGTTDGFCSVYVTAPEGSAIGATKVTAAAAIFLGRLGRPSTKLFQSTRFATEVSKLLGDLKAGAKANIEVAVTFNKLAYDCKYAHTATVACSGKINHVCYPKSANIVSAIVALFALLAVFAL